MDAILTRTHHWSFREKKKTETCNIYIFASVIRSKGLRLKPHGCLINNQSFFSWICVGLWNKGLVEDFLCIGDSIRKRKCLETQLRIGVYTGGSVTYTRGNPWGGKTLNLEDSLTSIRSKGV
jgi:hypothetical protein